jgi:hypothetical protein
MSHRDQIIAILQQVETWPDEDRKALVQELMRGAKALNAGKRPSFSTALGIARGEGAPPSDEDVKRWMDEYRTQKYGG